MSTDLKSLATDDFDIVSRRLELLSKSTVRQNEILTAIEKATHKILDSYKTELGQSAKKIEFAEKIILAIAEQHLDWFSDKKTLTTPFGSVAARRTTSHKYADEAHSIRLIKAAAARCEDAVEKARLLGLIRVKEELNLEAVECLGEKELARLQIVRVRAVSYSIKLAKPTTAKKTKGKKTEVAELEEAA